jgi:hypothetical protein
MIVIMAIINPIIITTTGLKMTTFGSNGSRPNSSATNMKNWNGDNN